MFPLFTAPWAFAALAALPALAALYWLRNSYRRIPVSSLMLWLEQAESRSSGLRVRRLRTPLLFFLELAALLLLAIAATGPRIETWQGRYPIVVVLDDSYSMRAGGADSPRQQAEAFLVEELSAASVGVRFVLAGTTPQSLGEPVTSSAELQQALAHWRCTAPTAKLSEALTLAAELGGPAARLLVVTDHAPAVIPEVGRLHWRAFGAARPNRALVRASRAAGEDSDRLYLEIANFAPLAQRTQLRLFAGDSAQQVHAEPLDLAAGEVRRLALRVPRAAPVLLARLDEDTLPIDDVAFLSREEKPPVRVELQIADEGWRALMEKSVQATGRTTVVSSDPHLVISDGVEAPSLAPETWLLQLLSEKEAEPYLGPFVLDRTHPLTDGLSLNGVVWGAGQAAEQPGMPVILAGNVPLVTAAEPIPGQHRLRLRLRPDLSTVTEAPAWPSLIWNLINWRARELPGLRRANLRLGEAVRLAVPFAVKEATLITPDQTMRALPVHDRAATAATTQVGVHLLRTADESFLFTVSAQNREESDLSNSVQGAWGEWSDDGPASSATQNIAWLFLLAVLGLLTAHMILAVRRG